MSTPQTRTTELHYIWHPTMGGSKSLECCLTVVQPQTRRTTRAGPHCMQWLERVFTVLGDMMSLLHNYYWSVARMSTCQMMTTKPRCIWRPTLGGSEWYRYCSTPVQMPAQRTPRARPHCT